MSSAIYPDEAISLQLRMLDYIDSALTKNGISYWLDSGTLLGSVRHKGFIPWDDDIDIVVLRKDYDRAVSVLNAGSERYKALTMDNTKGYFYLFAKVTDTYTHIVEKDLKEIDGLGIYVDLFPLDYLPQDDREYQKYVDRLFRLRKLIYCSLFSVQQLKPMSPGMKCRAITGKLLGRDRLLSKADQLCRRYSDRQAGYLANIVGSVSKNRKVPATVFEKTVYGEFEGKTYPIPAGYHEYLSCLYGDYMKLPPEEKRVLTHDYRAYRLRDE